MKKIKIMLTAVAMSAAVFLTGCDTNETLIIAAANTAGNLGLSAWFAIDDPDASVKSTLKEVVTLVEGASSTIGEGGSFVDALTPVVQAAIAKHDELTAAQKNLINTGSSVILSALDTFVASHEEVKTNAELANKAVSAFCQGCLSAIKRSENSAESKSIKKAHEAIKMQFNARLKAFSAE